MSPISLISPTLSPRTGSLEASHRLGTHAEVTTPLLDQSRRRSEQAAAEPDTAAQSIEATEGPESEENSERGLGYLHCTPPVADCAAAVPSPSSVTVHSRPPSPQHLAVKNRRLQILRAVSDLIAQSGCSTSAACAQVGVDQATYCRWRAAYDEHGESGLIPGYHRCGNRSTFDRYVTPSDRQWLIARLQYLNGKIGDASTAVRVIVDERDCPESLAINLRHLRRFPKSILRAAHISPQLRAKFTGPRNYELNSIVNIRTMTEVIDVREIPINPGDWWELDDMSLNQPFWFEVPDGDHPDWRASTIDGIALGRQGLYCQDISSGKWLGHMLVGRPRDAYRAEDILRFLRLLMDTWGKPRRGLRLERGIWRSTRITGYKIRANNGGWDPELTERPEMSQDQSEALVASIRQLGIEIVYCYSPHQKGFIEGGFRLVQKYMSATEFADIGRTRGENESATKHLLNAKAGRIHPAARQFAHIDEADAAVTWAESKLNNQHKDGRLQRGIPDERWVASCVRSPMTQLTRDELSVFLPERRELQIRGGHVTPEVDKRPFPFIAPEIFAELGNGYRLLVAFDPSDPSQGAALWNAENGQCNRRGWRVGQFLGWAQFDAPAPQFGGSSTSDTRKRYLNWHRTSFTAIKNFGGPDRHESAARDGHGNQVTVERTAAVPSQSTEPPTPSRATTPARERVRPCSSVTVRDHSSSPLTPPAAPEPRLTISRDLLARQAALSRRMLDEEDDF